MRPSHPFYLHQFYTSEEMNFFRDNDMFIENISGGLLLGPSHNDGGIKLFEKYGSGCRVIGEAEGFEYVINYQGAYNGSEAYDVINNYDRDKTEEEFEEYIPDNNIKIIDAHPPRL